MLFPKRTKYRKMHRRDSYKKEYRVNSLVRGDFGIKSLRSCRLTAKQLEAARKTMVKKMRRMGRILLRVFPDVAITSKPAEVRMGKGKGSVSFWARKIKIGDTVCELESTLNRNVLLNILSKVKAKLPFKTKIFLN